MVQEIPFKAEMWYLGYFEYVKFDVDVHFFCFRSFFASFIQKICRHFNAAWLISRQFTRRDLKPVAFLVLPYKAVLHAFFFLLFQAIGYTIIYTILLQQHFHTFNIWADIVSIVTSIVVSIATIYNGSS